MLRLGVLLSGGGTTLQNLLDYCADGRLKAEVVQVVASNPDAYGIVRATKVGVPTAIVERKACASRAEFSKRIFDHCRVSGVELVCMAGFLQLIEIPPDYAGRVLNIHPSLIPAFCGKGMYGHHVHEAVHAMGVKVTGCTIHFADNEYDHGPIVIQAPVPVMEDDTVESLAARVFAAECITYPLAIDAFASGRLRIEGRRVRVLPG